MIKFKNYIDLLDYMISIGRVNPKAFPHSKFFYIRYHLQEKFKKRFTIKKIIEIIDEEVALKRIRKI